MLQLCMLETSINRFSQVTTIQIWERGLARLREGRQEFARNFSALEVIVFLLQLLSYSPGKVQPGASESQCLRTTARDGLA